MTKHKCVQCGANGTGTVCGYCGSLLVKLADVEQEKKALMSLHRYIQEAEPSRQSKLLRNGFLPEYEDAIIAAGLRCIALIDNSAVASEPTISAVLRLRMIVTNLKLLPPSQNIKRAIVQFENQLVYHAQAKRRAMTLALVAIAILGAAIVAGYYGFFK